jgi:hypothetical protein
MGLRNGYGSASLFKGLNPDDTEQVYKLVIPESGAGLEAGSNPFSGLAAPAEKGENPYSVAGRGAAQAMNAGGSFGQTATSAGLSLGLGSLGAAQGTALAAAGPAGLALMGGGLLLSAAESRSKSEADYERRKIEEEEKRKANVQNALNQALGATRQLGV